jgi:hypothetical protein
VLAIFGGALARSKPHQYGRAVPWLRQDLLLSLRFYNSANLAQAIRPWLRR